MEAHVSALAYRLRYSFSDLVRGAGMNFANWPLGPSNAHFPHVISGSQVQEPVLDATAREPSRSSRRGSIAQVVGQTGLS